MRVAAPTALVPLERLGHRELGHDDRHPHHVALLNAAVDVHIGVMRAGAVFDGVLQEAEARQANPTEGHVVRAAGLARGVGDWDGAAGLDARGEVQAGVAAVRAVGLSDCGRPGRVLTAAAGAG